MNKAMDIFNNSLYWTTISKHIRGTCLSEPSQ